MSVESVNAAYHAALDSLSLEDIETAIGEIEANPVVSSEQSSALMLCSLALRRRRTGNLERIRSLRERILALLK